MIIRESDMDFGDYEDNKVFKIEKSKLKRKLGDGFKIVEFIALTKEDKLVFIEAKPVGYIKSVEMKHYSNKLNELSEKFENSIDIFFSIYTNRLIDSKNEVGLILKTTNYTEKEIICYLVIKDACNSLCAIVNNDLNLKMRKKLSIYNIQLLVINSDTARYFKLID